MTPPIRGGGIISCPVTVKNYENCSTFAAVIVKIKGDYFFAAYVIHYVLYM